MPGCGAVATDVPSSRKRLEGGEQHVWQSPHELLERRLAAGEISVEGYERLRHAMADGGPVSLALQPCAESGRDQWSPV
jgi:hypothetical protein